MRSRRKKGKLAVILGVMLIGLLTGGNQGFAKDFPPDRGEFPRVEKIRFGPHPENTRILVDLSEPVPYEIHADLHGKRITLTLRHVALGPKVRSRTFKDKNLARIQVTKIEGLTKIHLFLNSSHTHFFHYQTTRPSQIVLDFHGDKKLSPPAKKATSLSTTKKRSRPQPRLQPRPAKKAERPRAAKPRIRIKGMSPERARQVIRTDEENKLKDGWADYQNALKEYQKKNYPKANQRFDEFVKKYPQSKYLSEVLYLKGDALYKIAFREPHPVYEKAMEAYKRALREYPNSRFREHALFKIATIYDDMGYILEARTLYQEGVKPGSRNRYDPPRQTRLAALLIKEGKYEDAYRAFQKILEKSPKNAEARSAIFEIAGWYHRQKNFARAIAIYEDGLRRWPDEPNDHPEINFNIGEIYYGNKQYAKARRYFFDLINLDPASDHAHQALNLIGDSYLLEGKDLNALAVFDESVRRQPGSGESQYALIRIADIGVRNPRLSVRNIVFDLTPYHHPLKTYDAVSKSTRSVDILAEVSLSRGIALLRGQSYLQAIEEFKKLLSYEPGSRLYEEARKHIRQALILLVDRYSRQNGNLPILYAYSDFVGLSVGEINNVKTLLQVGEAYQAAGMHPQALQMYEKVKKMDTLGTYTDRIFLNLGQIHLDRKNFREAELVARTFLSSYPGDARVPDAMKLLARAYEQQQQPQKALEVYQKLKRRKGANIAETHYLIAETYQTLHQGREAARAYQRAITNFDRKTRPVPEYIKDAHFKLGNILFLNGQYAKAIESLESAIQLFPDHSLKEWADYQLAEAYTQVKNKAQASEQLGRLAKSEETDALLKDMAASKLKILEWEKQFKEFL